MESDGFDGMERANSGWGLVPPIAAVAVVYWIVAGLTSPVLLLLKGGPRYGRGDL